MDGAGDDDDDSDVPQHEKPADSSSNSRPTFHRPFLDVEDSSVPPEKLYKVCVSEVQNDVHAVSLHTGPTPTPLRKTPLCSSRSAGSASANCGSCCEAGELDERGPCEGEHRDDGGRDKRLHAALGLISLGDVSSDVAQVQLKSCTETATEDCSDGEIKQTFP